MNKSQKFWNRIAKNSGTKLDNSSNLIITHSEKWLNPESVVIDIGCGPGTITNRMANKVATLYGIDISPGMIEVARYRAKELGINNVEYSQGGVDSIPSNVQPDVVLAFNVIHFIDKPIEFFTKVHNQLKPGGYLITSTPFLGEKRNGQWLLMKIITWLGLVPKITFYKKDNLKNLLKSIDFLSIEERQLSNIPEYFLVFQKK